MRRQWPDWALDWPLGAKRQRLKCLIKKVKKSGGGGGIRTVGTVKIKKLQKRSEEAVPSRPLNSPDFAVDLAIAEYHSLCELLADSLQFPPPFWSAPGIRHLEVIQRVNENLRRDQSGILFVVGGNGVPGRVM